MDIWTPQERFWFAFFLGFMTAAFFVVVCDLGGYRPCP